MSAPLTISDEDSGDDTQMFEHNGSGYLSQYNPHSTSIKTGAKQSIMQPNHKVMNDPVWGFIDVEDSLVRIIDTPHFQRLRHLYQLGAAYYIFPGGCHHRFEHSIGTAHLAGIMCQTLRQNDVEKSLPLTDRVILLVKIAALCHDMGHGPFSHVFDGVFIPKIKQVYGAKHLDGWSHEDASEFMLKDCIRQIGFQDPELYVDYLSDDEVLFICQLINPKRYESQVFPELAFCYDIVSNSRCSIDVDKFDYITRDCKNGNIKSGFDAFLLLNNCKVIDNKICFHKKVNFHVFELFHTRYSLFKQVYTHRKIHAIEMMISDILFYADPLLKISSRIHTAADYITLTDAILQQIEHYQIPATATDDERQSMERAQSLCKRLHYRHIYKFVAELLVPPVLEVATKKLKSEDLVPYLQKNKSTLSPDDIIIKHITLNYAHKDKNPVESVSFYNHNEDTKSFSIPKDKTSLLAPSRFIEHYVRIYIKADDQSRAEADCKDALDAFIGLYDQMKKDAGLPTASEHDEEKQQQISIISRSMSTISNPPSTNQAIKRQFGVLTTNFANRSYDCNYLPKHLGKSSSRGIPSTPDLSRRAVSFSQASPVCRVPSAIAESDQGNQLARSAHHATHDDDDDDEIEILSVQQNSQKTTTSSQSGDLSSFIDRSQSSGKKRPRTQS